MKNLELQSVSIHIEYLNEMTVYELQESLSVLNEAFSMFYEKEHIVLSESNESSPKVVSLSEGSLLMDVVLPISCAMLPILYDIIKTAFASKKQYSVKVDETKNKWTDEDNYKLSKAVLEEYVIKKSKKSINDFISTISLSHIYKKDSIRAKIQNTKQLMLEDNISSTLSISPLKNYSKAHRTQFKKACKDLRI